MLLAVVHRRARWAGRLGQRHDDHVRLIARADPLDETS